MHARGRTDRHDEAHSPFSQFCERVCRLTDPAFVLLSDTELDGQTLNIYHHHHHHLLYIGYLHKIHLKKVFLGCIVATIL
jgi:hypothetical protein